MGITYCLRTVLAICVWAIAASGPTAASAQTLQTNRFHFEAGTEPEMPAGWSLTSLERAEAGLWIVALPGPVRPAWTSWLQGHGAIVGYVPHFAYLVAASPAATERIRRGAVATSVQPLHPAQKIGRNLEEFAFKADGGAESEAVRAEARSPADATALLAAFAARTEILAGDRPGEAGLVTCFVVRIDRRALRRLAADSRVISLERHEPYETANFTAAVILRSRTAPNQPNANGLTGYGQMIAVADTGLGNGSVPNSHGDFNDTAAYAGITPKIFGIVSPITGCSSGNDTGGHGTHVCGSALGTGLGSGAGTGYEMKGEAYDAQLYMQDTATNASLNCIPGNIGNLFNQAYVASTRCRVHSNSWGQPSVNWYNQLARDLDLFIWNNHFDMTICCAAGNNGPGSGSTVISPSTAKDCLTVGGTYNEHAAAVGPSPPPLGTVNCTPSGTPDVIAPFSSAGPTGDGRLKPDIVAPSCGVMSCEYTTSGGYGCWCGTSMATPHMAGLAALVRQHFAQLSSPHNASASLVKAVLLNGAYVPAGSPYNNNRWGYGRGDITQSLFPASPAAWTWEDEAVPMVSCAQSSVYAWNITDVTVPFRLTLVWSDAPALAGASPALVNDLDLTVTTPLGNVYSGNHIPAAAGIVALPDRANNVEQVWVKPGDAGFASGVWTATVSAWSLPFAPQRYSLVAHFGSAPGSPTATATPGAATATSSPTPVSCTATGTPSVTRSGTASATWTPTVTETATESPTSTSTPTATPSGPVVVAPNPLSISSGSGLTVSWLPPGTWIRIYSLAGDLVGAAEGEGALTWWPLTPNGRALASGVYVVVISRPGQPPDRVPLALLP